MARERIDVDELLARKAAAEATASEAGAQIEQHHAQLAEERERREQQFEAGVFREFDARDAALVAEQTAARKAFTAALIESPAMAAWIELRATRWARVALGSERQNAAARLGHERQYHQLEARDPQLFEDVLQIAEEEARARGLDRIDREIAQPRERYIAGEESDS